MRYYVLSGLLALGLAAGCQNPEAQRAARVLRDDLAALRPVIARVTTEAKVIAAVDAVAANASALDALLR